jgi:hypothetical protein
VTTTSRVAGPVVTVRVTSVVVVVTGVSATQPVNPNSASKDKVNFISSSTLSSFARAQSALVRIIGFAFAIGDLEPKI